ncbi:ankyrin repeat-containing domain protein [Aspergillus filifer]
MSGSGILQLPMELVLMVAESLPLADQAMLVEAAKGPCREKSHIEKALRNYKISQVLENAAKFSDHPAFTFFLPRVREAAEGDWRVGYKALTYACQGGSREAVRALLSDGIPFDPPVSQRPKALKNMHTPLSSAVNYSPNGVLELLVDAGADYRPYQANEFKVRYSTRAGAANELHQAALKDQAGLVQHLIIRGSDVNHPDQYWATPLIRAAELGHLNTAKVLLACGAQVNRVDGRGRTALSWAAVCGKAEMINLLLDAGAGINVADGNGHTPFILAVSKGHEKAVSVLLDRGVPINQQDKYERTGLCLAATMNKDQVVRLLINRGADINLPARSGRTPISYAAEKNNRKSGSMLMNAGCDLQKADNLGRLPIDYTTYVPGVLFPPPQDPEHVELMRQVAERHGLPFYEDNF